MDVYRQNRPLYSRSPTDVYAYQDIYGTVRGSPSGKIRPGLPDFAPELPSGGRQKKSFSFLPWKKSKSKGDEYLPSATGKLGRHHKYKFGSVSALSSSALYRDWDAPVSFSPSFSSSDLKHASVRSTGGLVTYPWESAATDVEAKNSRNSQTAEDALRPNRTTKNTVAKDPFRSCTPCRCQKKKSGPFGTLNLGSLKSTSCSCGGFSSVRSTRGFAPPPPPRRRSILPEKVDLYAVHEELDTTVSLSECRTENIYDTLSRSRKARAPTPPKLNHSVSRFAQSVNRSKRDPYSSLSSRKSILECDVTAYDLVKSYLKEDTDLDDDLSDNAIEGVPEGGKKQTPNGDSPSPASSESESGIYSQHSQGPSVRIGGHGMKLFPGPGEGSLYSEGSKSNSVDSRTSSWSNSSFSDDGIYSLPDPDYDDDQLFRLAGDTRSPRLRKYSSGSCLDSEPDSPQSPEVAGSPKFSTIRKATSMVSLAAGYRSGEVGTLKGRPRASKPPEVPTVAPGPPPPPPPPPPPLNFIAEKPPAESPVKPTEGSKKSSAVGLGSALASELSEKLRSNQPILRRKELVKPRDPPQVNSHNPYAEVKSILKKTADSPPGGAGGEPETESVQAQDDAKKKKRVQFKSLSNESLAVEQFQHYALSSSDEEWEEARETFDEERSLKKGSDIGKGADPKKEVEVKKNCVASKPSSIPRPTQPPPPPPIVRKPNVRAPPLSRSLGLANKSYSHSDLRISAGSARSLQSNTQSRLRAKLQPELSSKVADPVSSSSSVPKNEVSSPAASPEAGASSRGKNSQDDRKWNECVPAIYDDLGSESSYESLPSDDRGDDIYDDVRRCGEGEDRRSTVTCTIVSRVVPTEETPQPSDIEDRMTSKKVPSPDGASEDSSSSNEEVSSSLQNTGKDFPLPPPLPATLPPLPLKKASPFGIVLTVSDNSVSIEHYDTLPARRNATYPTPFESRRCPDTGATLITIGNSDENDYSSIYEELPDWSRNEDDDDYGSASTNPFGRYRGSFFEGASKAEILRFLEGAKERVVQHLDVDDVLEEDRPELSNTKNARNNPIRFSNISSSSDSSTTSNTSSTSSGIGHSGDDDSAFSKVRPRAVDRSDSGVGSETGKPFPPERRAPREQPPPSEELCADCDQQMGREHDGQCCPLVCAKCHKKRSERKEIVTEIVETEFKYGKDLMIIKEEFRHPMEIAGLLSQEQLTSVFLNLDDLLATNADFAGKLRDALDIASEQGDEDYTTVNIGKLFLETTCMLKAFETYCIRQGSASLLLASLEKEKELLRIFLRVSQMENTVLRRMNLSAFLMVPVQRVTKYPLLLSRLYKVTPYHHKDREALREAQLKIELHLEQINQQTKGSTGIKIWRRISNISASHRRGIALNVSDIGSIQLRKMAMEVLEWSKEDIRFVMASKLGFGTAADLSKSRRGRAFKFAVTHALLATKGRPNSNYRPDLTQEDSVLFPRESGIEDATLLLMKEKSGRYSLARDPLHLGVCVISAELEDEDIIEIQEHTTKESIYLKAECKSETSEWLRQLRYHAKDLGTWKRRRNGLANIMINGMIRQH